MKKIYILKCIAVILLITPCFIQAQDAMTVLDKIMDYYASHSTISYEMDIHYYEQLNSEVADYTAKMLVVAKEGQQYSRINTDQGSFEQFTGHGLSLGVNHSAKTIHFSNQKMEQTTNPGFSNILALAQLEEVQFESIVDKDKNKGLRLSAPHTSDTVIELFYDDHYRLLSTKLIISVLSDQYSNALNGKKIQTYFSYKNNNKTVQLSDFVQIRSGQYVVAQSLSGYTLLDGNL